MVNPLLPSPQDNPKALYIHCLAHVLNLSVQDVSSHSAILRDSLAVCHEIVNTITKSPKRNAILEQIKQDLGITAAGKITTFSSTR